jgi:hypothetical protein
MGEGREGYEDVPGTIEYTRKQLRFLQTIKLPSPTVVEMIRRYRAEVEAYEFTERKAAQQRVAGS